MIHIVSYSELDTARQCLHKHHLGYRERWVPERTSEPLAKGQLWHKTLEVFYQNRMAGAPTKNAADTAKSLVLHNALSTSELEHQELIEWMLDGYVEMWGDDPDWKVVGVEQTRHAWLPTDTGHRSTFKLKMKIDLIVEAHGSLWLVDHKSCQNLPSRIEMDLNMQFSLYCWGMKQLRMPIFGSIYSAARTQRNKTKAQPLEERFARHLLARTDQELDRLAVETWRSFRRLYQIKSRVEAERSPDPDRCRWRCPFTEPCLGGLKMGDEYETQMLGYGYRQDFTRH